MQDKKQKNSQKEESQETHIFEIHTMQGDIEKNKNLQKQSVLNNSDKKVIGAKKLNTMNVAKQQNIQTQKQKKPIVQRENPFLTQDSKESTNEGFGSFSPGQQKEPVEKINQTPADIVFDKDDLNGKIPKPQKTPKSSKKTMTIIIIGLIIIFLVGIVGFGFFMLKTNDSKQIDNIVDAPVNVIESNNEIDNDTNNEIEDLEEVVNEQINQVYATDLPNYFSIDVESVASEDDIKAELKTIKENMIQENIEGPISFIVTDKNNNPVSFQVFAISSGMNIPQDVLSSLEESFEIYVYNDEMLGVRFGFVIDVKNPDLLKTELLANESTLPNAFDLILNGLGASATNVVFNDSIYQTHSVRYFNLNEDETYSVDYTINDMQFIIGTSKNTLRKIVDYLKNAKISESSGNGFEY